MSVITRLELPGKLLKAIAYEEKRLADYKKTSCEIRITRYEEHIAAPGNTSSPFECSVEQILEYEECIAKLEAEYAEACKDAIDLIFLLDEPFERRVLMGRYLQRLSWDEIAAIIERTTRRALQLKVKAVQHLEEILAEKIS